MSCLTFGFEKTNKRVLDALKIASEHDQRLNNEEKSNKNGSTQINTSWQNDIHFFRLISAPERKYDDVRDEVPTLRSSTCNYSSHTRKQTLRNDWQNNGNEHWINTMIDGFDLLKNCNFSIGNEYFFNQHKMTDCTIFFDTRKARHSPLFLSLFLMAVQANGKTLYGNYSWHLEKKAWKI